MNVAVYGAAGYTGRFVVRELLRRGHVPIAIGRDGSSLAASLAADNLNVETRIASLESPEALDRALSGTVVVVHCAGPFLDTARPLIEAALRGRVYYLDVTAEQGSALSTFEAFDAPARDRGVVVIPAAGFFGGLGDVMATSAMGGRPWADGIEMAIALDRWWPTPGTRRTGQRNTAPRMIVSEGILTRLQAASPAPRTFPEPFGTQTVIELPFTETILMARHLHAREMRSFMNEAPLDDLRDPATPGPAAADENGRSRQQFVLEALVRSGDEEHRVTARGRDIYATTAPIVVEALERACSCERAGAFALGQLVDAEEFLESLVRIGAIHLSSDRTTKVS